MAVPESSWKLPSPNESSGSNPSHGGPRSSPTTTYGSESSRPLPASVSSRSSPTATTAPLLAAPPSFGSTFGQLDYGLSAPDSSGFVLTHGPGSKLSAPGLLRAPNPNVLGGLPLYIGGFDPCDTWLIGADGLGTHVEGSCLFMSYVHGSMFICMPTCVGKRESAELLRTWSSSASPLAGSTASYLSPLGGLNHPCRPSRLAGLLSLPAFFACRPRQPSRRPWAPSPASWPMTSHQQDDGFRQRGSGVDPRLSDALHEAMHACNSRRTRPCLFSLIKAPRGKAEHRRKTFPATANLFRASSALGH